jgi:hypothetical protein
LAGLADTGEAASVKDAIAAIAIPVVNTKERRKVVWGIG